MQTRRPKWADHTVWTEGLRPGTWVKAWMGDNGFLLSSLAGAVDPRRPVRVLFMSANNRRNAEYLANALRSFGCLNVSAVEPDNYPSGDSPWNQSTTAPSA